MGMHRHCWYTAPRFKLSATEYLEDFVHASTLVWLGSCVPTDAGENVEVTSAEVKPGPGKH
jgi:hypothetical protein